MPIMIQENADVELICETDDAVNIKISAFMDLLLIDNEYDWTNYLQSYERGGIQEIE